MRVSLSTSLHLDHGATSLDQGPGDRLSMQSFVPVGLLSLKAVLDQAGLDAEVRVIELNGLINTARIRNDALFHEGLVDAILEDGDDLVGLMTDADSLPHTLLMAQRVKQRSPRTRICLGGPASSPMGRRLMERFPFVDYVTRGEAEYTLQELVETLRRQDSPAHVRGLTWRDGGSVVENGARPVLEDLDQLPVPAFDAYDMAAGAPLYLDVGRGCPFKCHFCATAPFWDRRFRMKSIDRILREMVWVRDRYGRHHVNYSHDIFTCDRKWTLDFCDRLISQRLGMTWTCSTRTDTIDPQLLGRMAAAGCVEIYYGIETGSSEVQKLIHKGLDLDWAREIVRSTAAVGIRPITGFIVGHPTETLTTLGETLTRFFDFLEVGKVRAHLFTLCPFPEAPMYSKYADTVSRPAQYFELSLHEDRAQQIEQLKHTHGDLFSSCFRFDTPAVPTALVDASEELSCHLVLLKSLWPLLLPHYASALDWYTRWVEWIEGCNARRRPHNRLRHQGDAHDLLRFVEDELERLGLASSDIADLALYEKAKLDARSLAAPSRSSSETGEFSKETVVIRRCEYLATRFHHELGPLLAGQRTPKLPDTQELWVIFAKTGDATIDTIQMGRASKQLLELAGQPQTVDVLLERLREVVPIEPRSGMHLAAQLRQRGLLSEATG